MIVIIQTGQFCHRCIVVQYICSSLTQACPWETAPTMWHGYCEFLLDCASRIHIHLTIKETTMAWTKPEFIDWRFGFEITMYIANR